MLRNKALILGLMAAVLFTGLALGSQAIPNWPAPATWTPSGASGLHTMGTAGDVTQMLPFIGITPCRVADTRGNGFTGAYGPPSLAAGAPRSFTIAGQCGIPTSAAAVSFNFAALNIGAAGDLRVYPAGGVVPLVSTMNYNANTPNIANAAIVPLGTGGAIDVLADATNIDLIIDVNGYYSEAAASTSDYFAIIENYVPSGGVILGHNLNTTTTGSYGGNFMADSIGAGSAGVHGMSTATTGRVSGVLGESVSPTSGAAGVIGSAGGAPNANYTSNLAAGGIGVLGLNTGNYAIAGVSDFIAGNFINVSTGGTTESKLQFGLAANAMKAYGNVSISAWQSQLGDLSVAGTLTKGGGAFKIDDPIDPANKYLYHSFVESPDMMNIYNGNVVLDHNGEAVVTLPPYFEALNMDFRYQLTSVGKFSPVYVAEEIQNNQFVISGGRPYGKVSWQVTGIRHDPFANANRIPNEVEKEPAARGFYLHPAAYGKGPEMDLAPRLDQAAVARQGKGSNAADQ